MKKIFGKKDLAFWLGVILLVCVLPINYPMSKVEAQSIWVDPPADGVTDGPSNMTYSENVSDTTKAVSNTVVNSSYTLKVDGQLWVRDKIENHGTIKTSGGTIYSKNGIISDGELYIENNSYLYSDINSSGDITTDKSTIYGDIVQTGNESIYISGGTINGNITADSGSVLIDRGAIINGNISTNSGLINIKGAVINGNISSSSGNVEILDGTSVTGNITNDTQKIAIEEGSTVIGDVKGLGTIGIYMKNSTVQGNVTGREFSIDESSSVTGKIAFYYYGSGDSLDLDGKADTISTNLLYGGSWNCNSLEITPFDGCPIQDNSGSFVYLDEGQQLINNSGKNLLVNVWYYDDDSEYPALIPVGDKKTFSFNNDTFNNLCKVNKNLGELYVEDDSYGTFTLSNPLPVDLTYHIFKNSLYPFVLDANVQKGFNSDQYENNEDEKEDYSNTDVYAFSVPANSSKTVKVSVADDYINYGEKTITTGDILQFVKVEGLLENPMNLQLQHSENVAFITLTAKISKSAPKTEEKVSEESKVKDGSGSITVNDVYFGKTPKVNITSKTNDVSKATILFTGENYSSATAPTKPGTYKVTVTLPKNDNYNELVLTSNFKISYLPTPENPYSLKGNKGERNYYTQKVVITAPAGYTLSTSSDGQFSESIEISDSSESGRIYLKNADGEITDGIALEALLIDLKDPEIKNNSESESGSETAKIEISDENLYKIYVDSKEYSFNGTTAVIELKLEDGNGNQTFEIKAVDEAGREKIYTVELVSEWLKAGVIPKGGKLKIKKGQKFKLGDGVTGVEGDSTLYSSGVTFYTADEGEYIFK